jgi:hypothetical protein
MVPRIEDIAARADRANVIDDARPRVAFATHTPAVLPIQLPVLALPAPRVLT